MPAEEVDQQVQMPVPPFRIGHVQLTLIDVDLR